MKRAILGVTVSLLLGIAFTASPVTSMAQSADQHWTITGNLTPVSASAQFAGGTVSTLAATLASTDRSIFANMVGAPSYYTLSGTLQGNVYRYPMTLTVEPGYTAVAAEIGHDPITHQQLLEVALVSSPPTVQTGGSAASSPVETRSGSSALAPSLQTSDPSTSGYFETVWADPVGITTNLVQDNVSWQYNGTDVTSATYSDYRWWLSNDGWYEVSHIIQAGYTGNPTLWVDTWDEFQNNAFCYILGTQVQTYYEPNQVIAHGNGSISGSTNTYDYYSNNNGCPGLHWYTVVSGGA
jgi:hypothetical protein